jgi:micrococcal nuclease
MKIRGIVRKIPGFRSGSKVNAVIASVFYFFAFLILFAFVTPTNQSSTSITSPTPQSTRPTPIPRPTQKQTAEVKGKKTQQTEEESILVTKVVDGDTIKLENGEVVRYIGIDTPETVHPNKSIQCYGKEASAKNKKLVEGRQVKLEKDISERDKYGRLLRYVYVGDIFVNEYLVREGYAQLLTYPPDVKYQDLFLQAQKEARKNNRGLWNSCKGDVTATTQPTIPPQQQLPEGSCKGIICSYNAYNCPDFSTHAEAQNAYNCCGGVLNDIHKLDRDKDGSACETLP